MRSRQLRSRGSGGSASGEGLASVGTTSGTTGASGSEMTYSSAGFFMGVLPALVMRGGGARFTIRGGPRAGQSLLGAGGFDNPGLLGNGGAGRSPEKPGFVAGLSRRKGGGDGAGEACCETG